MNKIVITVIAAMSLTLSGCDAVGKTDVKETQAKAAEEAANSVQFTGNGEIANIKHKLELTSKPGALGFILLLNEMGPPIMYTGVVGKITSSGKRLTPPVKEWYVGGSGSNPIADAPSDEGTWGHSDDYIYFWTTSGQYMQWNGKYLYSDKPFRTNDEPLIVLTK